MNVSEARDIIAAYMLRAAGELRTSGNADLILRSMNNAKKFAQRRYDFSLTKVQASVSVAALPTGGALSTAVLYGTSTAVSIKKIRRAFITNSAGNTFPLKMASRDWLSEHLRIMLDRGSLTVDQNFQPTPSTDPLLIQEGDTLYFYPDITTTSTVVFDAYKWLADYGFVRTGTATSTVTGKLTDTAATFITWGVVAGDVVRNTTDGTSATVTGVVSETQLTLSADIFISTEAYSLGTGVSTDFFLDHCFDYLLYRSITELNFFLKEDQRVTISQAKMDEAWNSVLAWDSLSFPDLEV